MKFAFIDDRTRILVAVACIAVSVAVLVMAAIGWYYDSKVRPFEIHTEQKSHPCGAISKKNLSAKMMQLSG